MEKKNPLVLPPNFNDFPKPKNSKTEKTILDDDMDIKKILQKSNNTKESNSEIVTDSKSFEESLLKKINKN